MACKLTQTNLKFSVCAFLHARRHIIVYKYLETNAMLEISPKPNLS